MGWVGPARGDGGLGAAAAAMAASCACRAARGWMSQAKRSSCMGLWSSPGTGLTICRRVILGCLTGSFGTAAVTVLAGAMAAYISPLSGSTL